MGCVRYNTGAEELNIENLILEKKLLIEELLKEGEVPSSEDERKNHKIDKQISTQFKLYNNINQENLENNDSNYYYILKKNEYDELCLKWRMLLERKPVDQTKKRVIFIEDEGEDSDDENIYDNKFFSNKNSEKNLNNIQANIEQDSSAYARDLIEESKCNKNNCDNNN